MKNETKRFVGTLLLRFVVLVGMVSSINAGLFGKEETSGERFRKAIVSSVSLLQVLWA